MQPGPGNFMKGAGEELLNTDLIRKSFLGM